MENKQEGRVGENKPPDGRKNGVAKEGADARRSAAMVLEVLAGSLKPVEAASELGICLAGYYKLEERAIGGLVDACAPVAKGRAHSVEKEAEALRIKCRRLESECARYQAFARASQKAIGLNVKSRPPAGEKRGRRRKKPMVRALIAAKALRAEEAPPEPAESVVATV
jgi:hypothetical protein